MNRQHLLFLGIMLSGFSLSIPLILYANAQTMNDYRVFRKDFCVNEINLLNGINYVNGEDLSYGSSGCPQSDITISRWSELSTMNKTVISTRLATNGYTDVTSVIQQLEK